MRGTRLREAFCLYDCSLIVVCRLRWIWGELSGLLLQALTGISARNAAQGRGWRNPECAWTQHSPSGHSTRGPSAPLLEKDQVNWWKAKELSHPLKLPQEDINCINVLVNKHCKTVCKCCLCRVLNRNLSSLGIMKAVRSAKWFYNWDCQFHYIHLLSFSSNLFSMWVLKDQSWWGGFLLQRYRSCLFLCTSQGMNRVSGCYS